jgi:hypothetical protein
MKPVHHCAPRLVIITTIRGGDLVVSGTCWRLSTPMTDSADMTDSGAIWSEAAVAPSDPEGLAPSRPSSPAARAGGVASVRPSLVTVFDAAEGTDAPPAATDGNPTTTTANSVTDVIRSTRDI